MLQWDVHTGMNVQVSHAMLSFHTEYVLFLPICSNRGSGLYFLPEILTQPLFELGFY